MERQEQIERFTQAIRVLVELPKNCKVNMSAWSSCRMIACAGGWIAQDEWFNEKGLRLSAAEPKYDGRRGFEALQNFFGLSRKDVSYLFSADKYPLHAQRDRGFVIRRFQNYLRGS